MRFSWLEKVIVEKAVNEGCERVGGLVGLKGNPEAVNVKGNKRIS